MAPRKAFFRWAAIGLLMAVFLCWAQAQAVGGVTGMLQVGEASNLRPLIEEQLGEIPLAPGPGHDGQIYYAIALDLTGDDVGPLLDHAAYRYRRILSPVASSAFGLLDGHTLLWSQLLLGVLSMSFATGLVASMASRAGKSPMLALAVVLNPGVWLSVQLLTPDAMALALMVAGLDAVMRQHGSRVVLFSLSGVAKDVNLATPVPLGAARRDWPIVAIPATVLVAWMTFLEFRFGGGFAARGNLDWPLTGLLQGTTNWPTLDTADVVYLVVTLVSVALGVVFTFRRSWLRWPIGAWTGLAIISSSWVWDYGNNAARALSPLLVLLALSYVNVEAAGTAGRRTTT